MKSRDSVFTAQRVGYLLKFRTDEADEDGLGAYFL